MIIKKVKIKKFRAIKDAEFSLGKYLTAIVGRNRTMKSTLLGIISTSFSISKKEHPLFGEKTLNGYNFKSQFGEKFKFDLEKEKAGDHEFEVEFEDGIHEINPYKLISIPRGKDDLRFWYAKSKERNTGFAQVPVYFLSLSRLSPVGESSLTKNTKFSQIEDKQLSEEAVLKYAEIMTATDRINNTRFYGNYAGVNEEFSSILTNSAGQSDVVKIIHAVLSFKNLSKKKGKDYIGGILLIDEVDVTLHPSAQIKLVDYLAEESKNLKIQIIFTTHSNYILERLKYLTKQDPNKNNNVILFLQRKDKVTIETINTIAGFNRITADLELREYKPIKINVYCEDIVARKFLRSILPKNIKDRISIKEVSLSAGTYVTLRRQKINEFEKSIIVLDGDVKTVLDDNMYKYFSKCSNIISFPDSKCFEIEIYEMLIDYENKKEEFKDIFQKEFDVCIQDYLPIKYQSKNDYNQRKEFCKRFFHITNIQTKLIKQWKENNMGKCEVFIRDFGYIFNSLAKNQDIEEL